MSVTTINISSKGQIVLPKKIRNILNTDTITLTINEQNQVVLSPISELGGTLSDYNTNSEPQLEEIEELSLQDQKTEKTVSNETDNINNDND